MDNSGGELGAAAAAPARGLFGGYAAAGVIAAAIVLRAAATDYFVDANFGNDDWDGTTAEIPTQQMIDAGGSIPGPRRTLQAMMGDERVQPGDVVRAAEGDYNDGCAVSGTSATRSRVLVKAGVTLVATGSKAATFITGSGGDYTNDSIRCVQFLAVPSKAAYGGGIVKGFTVRDGRTASSSEHGGAAIGAGLLVDCVFRNNGCMSKDGRGGTLTSTVTALRCRFESVHRGYNGYAGTRAISCVIEGSANTCAFYSSCKLYNCTLFGITCTRKGSAYNCLYIGTGASVGNQKGSNAGDLSHHYNDYSRSNFGLAYCDTNGTCRVVTAAESPYDAVTYRPLPCSLVIDAADPANYAEATNGWCAAWLAEGEKDYFGGDRCVNGAIDVGCGEMQARSVSLLTISDSSTGLVLTGASAGESTIPMDSSVTVTFSRNFTSPRLCTGVEINGVFHSFGDTVTDQTCTETLEGRFDLDYTVTAVYETDQKHWYVSPTGDDTNRGYHRKCPRRTLDKAMELATADRDNVVHAAAGVYDTFSEGYDARSRVTVKTGTGLVADEWPNAVTEIRGAPDTSENADSKGNGPAAIRCVRVGDNGYVKGFLLTNGRTTIGESNSNCGGAAYMDAGALIDCELTGNGSGYRGVATVGGALIRCHVHDNPGGGSYTVYRTITIDTYVGGSFYAGSMALNSTVTGEIRAGGTTGGVKAYNTYLGYARRGTVCTNCVFTYAVGSTPVDNLSLADEPTCSFGVAMAGNLDAVFRPVSPGSPLVDAGSYQLYEENFPTRWAAFKSNLDRTGGQRVYNGRIDVGCGEYDWRPAFAAKLGRHAVVDAMGPNVTTNATAGLTVPEGESIGVSIAPRAAATEPTRYELVYTPEGGEPVMIAEASEEPFARTLDGPCLVNSLSRYIGLTVLFR